MAVEQLGRGGRGELQTHLWGKGLCGRVCLPDMDGGGRVVAAAEEHVVFQKQCQHIALRPHHPPYFTNGYDLIIASMIVPGDHRVAEIWLSSGLKPVRHDHPLPSL